MKSCNFSGEVKSCAIGSVGARLRPATRSTEKLESWKVATIYLSPSMNSCMITKDLGQFGKLDDNFSPLLNSCNFSLQRQLCSLPDSRCYTSTFQLSNFSPSLACRFVHAQNDLLKGESEGKAFFQVGLVRQIPGEQILGPESRPSDTFCYKCKKNLTLGRFCYIVTKRVQN